MNIDVRVDSSGLNKWLGFLAQDLIPYACARTLTMLAQDAQAEVRRELPRRFTIRNTFVEKGVKIKPASKSNLQSEVYAQMEGAFSLDFMLLQEEGGTKRPRGQNLAIPVDAKRSKRDIVTQANRPKALLRKKGYFISHQSTAQTAHLFPGVYKRMADHRLSLLFDLEPRASVPSRWDFVPTVLKVAQERLPRLLSLSVQDALK